MRSYAISKPRRYAGNFRKGYKSSRIRRLHLLYTGVVNKRASIVYC